MKDRSARSDLRELFLNGRCASFVQAYVDLHPEAVVKIVEDEDEPLHIVVEHDGKIVDITGQWNDLEQYFENLDDEYVNMGYPSSFGMLYRLYNLEQYGLQGRSVDEICRSLSLIRPSKKATRIAKIILMSDSQFEMG